MKKINLTENNKVLIYFALKYKGDWKKIYLALKYKEEYIEKELLEELKRINCNIVTMLDNDYPYQFKNIKNPPFVLFYYGDLSIITSKKILAVVGSRKCSSYGKEACEKVLKDLNKEWVIVSGLAEGIDTIAHQVALDNNLKTIAILGVGIDKCYPKQNFKLYERIKEKGLIISEYPYKEVVSKMNFTFRNRLISALSNGILIPECQDKSGSLITLRYGLEQGKDIMVIPSSISLGTYNNSLIQQGAIPIICSNDIEEQLK